MDTAEYKQMLRELGVRGSITEAASHAATITGMAKRTCIRYANGEANVPEPVARLLRSLVALKGLGYELDDTP